MFKKLTFLFIVCSLCIVDSCEYESKKVFERETIDNPDLPTIQSVNLDLKADTIYIYSSNIFIYDFSSNKRILSVRFILDNIEQYEGKSSCTSFRFKNSTLTDGIHTLGAEVYVGSGTNSLADAIGVEGYLMTKTWILKVDKNYYSQTFGRPSNGYLKISWPKYMSSDFIDYSIYRQIGYRPRDLIKRLSVPEFIDSSYVGESGDYYVTVNRKDLGELEWGSVSLPNEMPKAGLVTKENNTYLFCWTKSKYYNGVDKFNLVQNHGYTDETIVKSTRNPDDTIFYISSSSFGESVNFNLNLLPKKGNLAYEAGLYSEFYTSNTWEVVGYPFKVSKYYNVDRIRQVNSDEFVYVQNSDTIMRYSTSKKQVVDRKYSKLCGGSYPINIQVTHMKMYISSYHYCNNTLLIINTQNFSEFSTKNISAVAPYAYDPIMSDNNILVSNSTDKFSIYDLTKNMLLATYSTFLAPVCYSISSNGEYLYLRDDSSRLVKFINPGFKKIWANPDSYYNMPKYFEFHALNSDQLAYWNGNTFFIKSCNDFSTVYEFPLNDKLLNIDYFNSKMLCYKPGHFLIRSLIDGTIINDIPIDNYPFFYSSDFYLVNNALICRKGVMYFLN